MIDDAFIAALKEGIREQEAVQRVLNDRALTDDERRGIAAFQAKVLHLLKGGTRDDDAIGDDPWMLDMRDGGFELLRDAVYPAHGAFDLVKHILGGRATALCGAATGQRVAVVGRGWYCQRCLQTEPATQME